MRTLKTIAPFWILHQRNILISICHFYQCYYYILLWKVCKSDCIIVTLLLLSYLFCIAEDNIFRKRQMSKRQTMVSLFLTLIKDSLNMKKTW